MTPAARLQAAIEILDEVVASARADGPPADAIVSHYFRSRRYAGSKDRRAVRELAFSAIRLCAECPENGRSAILALAAKDQSLVPLFGEPRGPAALDGTEEAARPGVVPDWLQAELSSLVTPHEWPMLLERAPLDLRVNVSRTSREAVVSAFDHASATPLSPWGIRLPPDTRVDDHLAFREGLFEVQDEGSQLIALACTPTGGEHLIDLCAGAGGKSLAIAAAQPETHVLATDSNRVRLGRLAPRAERAGASIETRLLSPPHELAELSEWTDRADLVLIDAPCSGSGTWRRNPEGRWRLVPERLDRLVALQQRLLGIGASLVRPGGLLVYAVCSLLSCEGAAQIGHFLEGRSSWISEQTPISGGRRDGAGLLLTPGHDQTDGFFVARLRRPC